jgi:diacylglycerol kinase
MSKVNNVSSALARFAKDVSSGEYPQFVMVVVSKDGNPFAWIAGAQEQPDRMLKALDFAKAGVDRIRDSESVFVVEGWAARFIPLKELENKPDLSAHLRF